MLMLMNINVVDLTIKQSWIKYPKAILKSKDTLLENDFGKSESRLLEYNLSKSR